MAELIIIGAGGHTKVLIDILQQRNQKIIGILEGNKNLIGTEVLGIKVLGLDDAIADYPAHLVQIVNGVGSTITLKQRRLVFNRYKDMGYHFHSVIHPSACIAKEAVLGEGVQIMAGSIIQPGCYVGDNTIINTRVSIDHDCFIGNHVHIAPGAVLSGSVRIEQNVHIGTGAVIIQGLHIDQDSLIGAGSVVIRDVPAQSKISGVPARQMQ